MVKINRTELVVYGVPIAQPRHRIAKSGGRYIPADHPCHEWKQRMSMVAQTAIEKGFELIKRPLAVQLEIYFHMPKPKVWRPKHGICHTKRPDLDNLVKAVKDALNGVAYEDDSQICRLIAYKDYNDQPKVTIRIATND